jgi:hypothetical protein
MSSMKNNIVYQRPTKTYQERLTNQDIKEILKDYILVEDIKKIPIGTHVRYFITDNSSKKKFRLGGMITKIDPLGRYIMLSNGQTQPWSVQLSNTIFYKKLTDEERKEEIKKEILTEINTENKTISTKDKNIDEPYLNDLKKKMKVLMTKINHLTDENNTLKKKNEKLNKQLSKIQIEIDKK